MGFSFPALPKLGTALFSTSAPPSFAFLLLRKWIQSKQPKRFPWRVLDEEHHGAHHLRTFPLHVRGPLLHGPVDEWTHLQTPKRFFFVNVNVEFC